jgi:hypothetical protein
VIQKGLAVSKPRRLIIEERKFKHLEAASDVGVNMVLEDGKAVYMGFLVHKPVTTLVAEDLVNDPNGQEHSRDRARGTQRMSRVFMSLVTLADQFQTSLLRWHMV